MAVDFKIIGNRIKKKRKEKAMTQEELANKLYVSVGYVSNMERGTTKINLSTLSDIADILECDVSEFVSDTSVGGKTYLKNEMDEIIAGLNEKERKVIFEIIKAYIKNK